MKTTAFKLEGTSMAPLFTAGQVVLAVPPAGRVPFLAPGDCAVYEYEGRLLLHRVVRTGPGGVWFSDDAARIEPHFVPWPAIRGQALSRNPFSGGLPGRIYSGIRRVLSPLFR